MTASTIIRRQWSFSYINNIVYLVLVLNAHDSEFLYLSQTGKYLTPTGCK